VINKPNVLVSVFLKELCGNQKPREAKMKRIYSLSKFILPILFFSFTLINCGGGGGGSSEGGGGGGGPPPPATITYVGLTTPASLTEGNSEDMILGSLLGPEAGTAFSLTAESKDEQSQHTQGEIISNHPIAIDLPLVLKNTAKNISFANSKGYSISALTSTRTETINGNCGGTAKYTLNINDATGSYDGTFIFTQYCEDEIVISGDTNISGTLNLATGEIITVQYVFENLTVDEFIYKGNIFHNYAVTPLIITLDVLAKDSTSDKVFWAKDYSILITDLNATDIEIEVTGTYYDPDQGYVTVSTPEPLLVSTEDWPILGILLCVGDKNTKARLTVINDYSYKIEADTNGDDTYDYNSGVLIWPGANPPSPWQQKASMPTPRLSLAAGEVNGKIYALGGMSSSMPGEDPLNAVEEYNPVYNIWTIKSPMPTSRYRFAVGVINGKLYAIGGTIKIALSPNSWTFPDTNVVEEYDPVTNTWATKSPMPTARNSLAAAVINGKIYLIGGHISSPYGRFTGIVEEYDPATDSWTSRTSMPTPRAMLAVSVINDKVYAIGGSPQTGAMWTDVVEEYNPLTDTWNTKPNMPSKRAGLASSVVHGEAYLMGGANAVVLNIVEKYSPATDAWISKTSMPETGTDFAAGVVNDKIYVIGIGDYSKVYEYDPSLDP